MVGPQLISNNFSSEAEQEILGMISSRMLIAKSMKTAGLQ